MPPDARSAASLLQNDGLIRTVCFIDDPGDFSRLAVDLHRGIGNPMNADFNPYSDAYELAPVFALDLAGGSIFAFKASDAETAQLMSRSASLLQSIDDFCRARSIDAAGQLRFRVATTTEAALYRDRASEFADATPHILIAHLRAERP